MRLKDKVIVVTGASAGMGRAMVEVFVKEGAKVLGVARRQEVLEEIKDEVAGGPGQFAYYVGDVSKKEVCEGMIDFAVEQFGRLDSLVNNAGMIYCASKAAVEAATKQNTSTARLSASTAAGWWSSFKRMRRRKEGAVWRKKFA